MKVSRDCWQCEYDDCGHVWIKAGDDPPTQCAKCRRRNWHTPESAELVASMRKSMAAKEPKHVETLRKIPGVKVATDIPAPARPAHAPTCTCFVCRAARGGK